MKALFFECEELMCDFINLRWRVVLKAVPDNFDPILEYILLREQTSRCGLCGCNACLDLFEKYHHSIPLFTDGISRKYFHAALGLDSYVQNDFGCDTVEKRKKDLNKFIEIIDNIVDERKEYVYDEPCFEDRRDGIGIGDRVLANDKNF